MRPDPWNRPTEHAQEKWWWILKNPVGFVILATVIIVFVVIFWHILTPYPKNSEGISVIHASTDPIKVKPDHVGGDLVPHQDKMVYEKLVKKGDQKTPQEPQIEHLVPPPALNSMFETSDDVKNKILAETHAAPPSTETPTESIDALIEQLPAAENKENKKDEKQEKGKKPKPPVKAEKPEKEEVVHKPIKGFKVQIASLPTQQKAEQEWARVKKSNKDILKDRQASYKTIDLGNKGNYTRVQIEGFSTRDEAVSICERLKQRRVNCIVVK